MRCRLALIIVIAAVLIHSASASFRPSFELDYSSWHATDIVVVMATERGGSFVVIESLKGNLLPGEVINIPELKPDKNAREIPEYPQEKFSLIDSKVPKQIAGSQLILFLKSMLVHDTSAKRHQQPTSAVWQSTDLMHDMKASAVWLYGDKLYVFRQRDNPGGSLLTVLEMPETKLRARVSEIVNKQQQLNQASLIADPQQRAEALKPYVTSKIFPASQFALDELGKCGTAAVPTIRGMLDDAAFAPFGAALIRRFVRAGGVAIADELVSRLGDKLKFWQTTAPMLRQGWWNDVNNYPATPSIREQYGETLELIRGLDELSYSDALRAAVTLRDFWRATPQLNDPAGLSQLAEESDRLIAKLQARGSNQ